MRLLTVRSTVRYTVQTLLNFPNAKVIGDVYYKTIEIHLGAVIEGRLVHQPGASENKVVPLSG